VGSPVAAAVVVGSQDAAASGAVVGVDGAGHICDSAASSSDCSWLCPAVGQVRRRPSVPARYSIGALEIPLQQVRDFMEPRVFCYRNAERTHRMLELVSLRLNKLDDTLAYWLAA
jgi:hypothetical protein